MQLTLSEERKNNMAKRTYRSTPNEPCEKIGEKKTNYHSNTNNKKRYLAKGIIVSNNSHETQLNNNDVIIGASGSGKTTSYVYGNIAGLYGSYVIADTKGDLAAKFSPMLKKAGYDVKVIDFVDTEKSVGYNPMDYIRRKEDGTYNEQDVQKLAHLLSPVTIDGDPYWESSAENLICALIALAIEFEEPQKHNLSTVADLSSMLGYICQGRDGNIVENGMKKLFDMFEYVNRQNCNSFAYKRFSRFKELQNSDKTWSCVISFVNKAFTLFDISSIEKMFLDPDKVDLTKLGREKCALFVNVSDVDRSLDTIVNIFYSQLFQNLISEADNNGGKLDVPVRIILDDFATNVYVPDFDKIISVIRSRDISVSIILQSITQLNQLYGQYASRTIINNCDHLLYLGGHDYETSLYISQLANVPLEKVIDMPLDKQFILTRGEKAVYADRIPPDSMKAASPPNATPKQECSDTEMVVLNAVPRALLRSHLEDDKQIYFFNFAYRIEPEKVIYAGCKLAKENVILNGRWCNLILGAHDKKYLCEMSDDSRDEELTAAEISDIFRKNKGRYIAHLKKSEAPKRLNDIQ